MAETPNRSRPHSPSSDSLSVTGLLKYAPIYPLSCPTAAALPVVVWAATAASVPPRQARPNQSTNRRNRRPGTRVIGLCVMMLGCWDGSVSVSMGKGGEARRGATECRSIDRFDRSFRTNDLLQSLLLCSVTAATHTATRRPSSRCDHRSPTGLDPCTRPQIRSRGGSAPCPTAGRQGPNKKRGAGAGVKRARGSRQEGGGATQNGVFGERGGSAANDSVVTDATRWIGKGRTLAWGACV